MAGAMSLMFVYSLDFARTRLANDAKGSKKGGGVRQFNGLLDVYKKTMASDGVAGLYRGFCISCVGIVVYRGCYFGFYDTLKPMLLGDDAGLTASFCLGYAVTVCSGLISYPIDTIRRRMMMTSGEAVKYSGSLDCGRQILANEGFMSMMKGAGANVLRGAAGAMAGAMSLMFVYSLDFARTRLANDAKGSKKGGGVRQFNGLLDVYKKTMASDGVAGLYRGFCISCVGIVVYRGCYFGFYDTLKPMLLGDDAGLTASFCLGYAVTVCSGLISYPIDTIRRRMMMTSGEAVKYSGSLDCGRQILANEGFMSMMKGAGANVLRGAAGAGVLAGFDKVKVVYIDWKTSSQN
jgi:hypothetical protein